MEKNKVIIIVKIVDETLLISSNGIECINVNLSDSNVKINASNIFNIFKLDDYKNTIFGIQKDKQYEDNSKNFGQAIEFVDWLVDLVDEINKMNEDSVKKVGEIYN